MTEFGGTARGGNLPEGLDAPVWSSLRGAHANWAETRGRAVRYPTDRCPFAGVDPDADEAVWDDLADLVGPGGLVTLAQDTLPPPGGWDLAGGGVGLQMIDSRLDAGPDPDAVPLGAEDVPSMLDLVDRTRPGPFRPRTIELGNYLGIRHGGVLIAMAGERLRPPGWTEISAVCTDDSYRGHGLASRLVRSVAAGIRARGDRAFLHVASTNTNAIRLYEQLGFTLRRTIPFRTFRVPPGPD